MLQAINPINAYPDYEHLRILQELRSLGITPSGTKSIDKAKLEQAKAELILKIKDKEHTDITSDLKIQIIDPAEAIENTKRSEMEEQRLGAMTIAELNKIYFHL